MGRLDGKVAIVTGGASGIGKGAAIAMAEEGAAVMVTDVDDLQGEEVAAEIQKNGGKAAYRHQDTSDETAWPEIVGATVAAFGPLAVLVNNAGIAIGGAIEDFSLEDWRKQNAVNLDGVFMGTREAIRTMKTTGGGSIINVSSVAGLRGSAGLGGYCASKGGVRLFSKAAAVECARAGYKIRVNSVHPGIIDTPIWQKSVQDGWANDEALANTNFGVRDGANQIDVDALAESVPLGIAGVPKDIADGIVFLASDESRYVTGTELVIDGGVSA